jgi:spore maturation protein B
MLIRPLSESGALAAAGDIIRESGADSLAAARPPSCSVRPKPRFYTIAVYFGAAKVKKSRYAIPAALLADLTGFAVAALTARLLY